MIDFRTQAGCQFCQRVRDLRSATDEEAILKRELSVTFYLGTGISEKNLGLRIMQIIGRKNKKKSLKVEVASFDAPLFNSHLYLWNIWIESAILDCYPQHRRNFGQLLHD